jgi:hypothetical protein
MALRCGSTIAARARVGGADTLGYRTVLPPPPRRVGGQGMIDTGDFAAQRRRPAAAG